MCVYCGRVMVRMGDAMVLITSPEVWLAMSQRGMSARVKSSVPMIGTLFTRDITEDTAHTKSV